MKELGIYNNTMIKENEDGMYNLTDMWSANGRTKHNPSEWSRQKDTLQLIETVGKNVKYASGAYLKTGRGRYGGTYACIDLAIAYAEYLSPEFHLWVIDKVKLYVEETINPEKGIERNINNYKEKYKRLGKSDEWINTRLIGITQRNNFTSTIGKIKNLSKHGYAMITDDMNQMLLGESASGIKKKMCVKITRDGLTPSQLMVLALGEDLAVRALNKKSIKNISKGEAIDTMLDAIQQLSEVVEPLKIRS